MSRLCLSCDGTGIDPDANDPIERGAIRSDPRGAITWNGQPLRLSPSQCILIHSLLKAGGRIVTSEILADRMGYEGDNPKRLISVMRHEIAKRIGFALPIETIRCCGLRWAA